MSKYLTDEELWETLEEEECTPDLTLAVSMMAKGFIIDDNPYEDFDGE